MNATTIRSDPQLLLEVWERGAACAWPARGLLLLSQAVPHPDLDTLARLTIGQRDAHLLSLRETLFGSRFECLTHCTRCDALVELDFQANEIRAAHAKTDQSHCIETKDCNVTFRLPDSTDLLAIQEESDAEHATQVLLTRCVLEASEHGKRRTASDLSKDTISSIVGRMSELDPQAEVMLDLVCPNCTVRWQTPFDIVSHLWSELDAWARSLLRDVHALAGHYGWSESAIVAMTPQRRRLYLDLLGV
jgi:hypothetical protein